jgi:hypothetical protein
LEHFKERMRANEKVRIGAIPLSDLQNIKSAWDWGETRDAVVESKCRLSTLVTVLSWDEVMVGGQR